MHTYHILNGDCLKEQFPKELIGELLIARECLVEGDVTGETLEEFWKNRATYIFRKRPENKPDYYSKTVSEFEKIINIPAGSEINLWFEEDLFCQVNLWFCIHLLKNKINDCKINLIRPFAINRRGFGALSEEELIQAYRVKKHLNKNAIILLSECWVAFKTHDLKLLKKLSFRDLDNFPVLPEVALAHADRFAEKGKLGRPERVLLKIIKEYKTRKFGEVFRLFSKKAGIYGFGDLQVKTIYENVIKRI